MYMPTCVLYPIKQFNFWYYYLVYWSADSSVCIVTGRPRNRLSIPGTGCRLFFYPECSERLQAFLLSRVFRTVSSIQSVQNGFFYPECSERLQAFLLSSVQNGCRLFFYPECSGRLQAFLLSRVFRKAAGFSSIQSVQEDCRLFFYPVFRTAAGFSSIRSIRNDSGD